MISERLFLAPNGLRPMFCRFSELRNPSSRKITFRKNLNTLQAKIYNSEHRIAFGVIPEMALDIVSPSPHSINSMP